MAFCSPPPSPSSVSTSKSPSFHSRPSPSFPPSSPYTLQCPSASQLRPSLIARRGFHCSPVRVSAFHTHPDTSSSPPTSLYHVLQVPPTATLADIKAAYRRLAHLYHPDARGAATTDEHADKEARTKLFLQIHSAYATLSDAQTRARYDLQLSAQVLQCHMRRVSTPLSTGNSYLSTRGSSGFSSHRIGRNWESDQCW